MKFTFNVWEKTKKAWVLYKENFGSMIILGIIMFGLQMISQGSKGHNVNLPLFFIILIVSMIISYVWVLAILNLLDGKGFNPFSKKLLPTLPAFWDYLKTNILISLCVVPWFLVSILIIVAFFVIRLKGGSMYFLYSIPVALLIMIPGFYIAARLFPAKYLSIEKCQGARKSIKEAWKITKDYGWKIFGINLLAGLFIVLGFVAFFVGVLVTFPVVLIVLAMIYRDLVKFKATSSIDTEKVTSKKVLVEEV